MISKCILCWILFFILQWNNLKIVRGCSCCYCSAGCTGCNSGSCNPGSGRCRTNGKFCYNACPRKITCNACISYANGGCGTCTSSLMHGGTCQPTCKKGYIVTGTTSCSNGGSLTPAACNSCKAGFYQPSETGTATKCTPCEPGRVNNKAAGNCESCPKGQYSADSTTVCTKCPRGTYSATSGAKNISQCIDCDAGRYNPNTGMNSESTCIKCNS